MVFPNTFGFIYRALVEEELSNEDDYRSDNELEDYD